MDWLYAIPMTELAINNSIQDRKGLSSAHIVYGTPIKMLVDMLHGLQGGTTSVQEVKEMQEL